MIRCFLSFVTSLLVSRYFNARKGHSNRFTFVSMIPAGLDEAPTVALRAADCAANDCWWAKETSAALSREFFKKRRRSMGFMRGVIPSFDRSKLNLYALFAQHGCGNPSEIPTEDFCPVGL